MPSNVSWDILIHANLSAPDLAAALALLTVCNAAEGLDLKLALDNPWPAAESAARHFLVHAGADLVGYAGLDGDGPEVELCGMVHPRYRRQGIGRALLDAAVAACRARAVRELLLICEAGSVGGQALAAQAGATYQFGEDRMELTLATAPARPSAAPAVLITPAGAADAPLLAAIEGAVFADPVARTIERVQENLADPATQYYLVWLDGIVVGSGRILHTPERAYLYAFGVLPAYRGRGVGRAFLHGLFALLQTGGYPRLALEVETENAPAITLYGSCGFGIITTYGYFAVPLGD
ncbi:MAG: GNAT family N-acetyltransferase [Chloroflexota bacterium]|nr:GNAT family N-acetyltransferase [Chloroflexota bacterium]